MTVLDRSFSRFDTIDLNERGELANPATGRPIAVPEMRGVLPTLLHVPPAATDIFVFAHGWRTSSGQATAAAARLFGGIEALYREGADRYPALGRFQGYYVAVRWPSISAPFLRGYRRIRQRAHDMTNHGHAATVLSHLLGYLHSERTVPRRGANRLTNLEGQYLHCIGHSFGGRFLGEAIAAAADPPLPPTLGWPWAREDYPFAVDTLVVFQMAARPTIFDLELRGLLRDAPINGPIALTFSRHDRATSSWHRIAEGTAGVGAIGARSSVGDIGTLTLHRLGEPYTVDEMAHRIVNIDSQWRYRRGRLMYPAGAHSDIWHKESVHLVLSLAALAR